MKPTTAAAARRKARPARAGAATPGLTCVIDAGARYGMHPSWRGFGGPLRYLAFEPDPREAERLRAQAPEGTEVIAAALGRTAGRRGLRLAAHRGCSSFLEVDQASEWFGRFRPGEGALEGVVQVPVETVDGAARTRGISVDFLKVDTEGTELEVLEGAQAQLRERVLGVRVNGNFRPAYKGQPSFLDVDRHLAGLGFVLLNLDYFGRGVPRFGLFRNPDPQLPDRERYGVLVATDGVWIRESAVSAGARAGYQALKLGYFCLLNHAADVGLDVLTQWARRHAFTPAVTASPLYRASRRAWAMHLGRWRVVPGADWELARETFTTLFGLELESGSKFWEQVQQL